MLTRELFIRIATRSLERHRALEPARQAELLAEEIDRTVELLRELKSCSSGPILTANQQQTGSLWPTPNPDSVSVKPEAEPLVVVPVGQTQAQAEAQPQKDAPQAEKPLLAPDDSEENQPVTRLPESPRKAAERVEQWARKQRALSSGQETQKIRVEDLNLLIQERTPSFISVQVQLQEGAPPVSVSMAREVLSAHAENCVKLLYYHPKAPKDLYVQEVITTEDVPVDLAEIVERLKKQAEAVLKPMDGPIRSVAPPLPDGPVTAGEVGVSSSDLSAVRTIWESMR